MLILLGLHAQAGSGQGVEWPHARLHVTVSRDRASLADETAAVGAVSAQGWSVALGIRTRRRLGAELFVSSFPANQKPGPPAPKLTYLGGWVTGSLLPPDLWGVDVFAGVGATVIRVRSWSIPSQCLAVDGCMYEGGLHFHEGTALSPVLGAGVLANLGGLMLRLDYRTVLSTSSVSGNSVSRWGVGGGLALSLTELGFGS